MNDLQSKLFDFHFHGYGGGEDWTPKVRSALDGGELSGILCCTDLNSKHEEFEEKNRPLLELAHEKGAELLSLAAMIHPDRKGLWRMHAEKWFDKYPELVALKLKPELTDCPICPEYIDMIFDFANERDLLVVSHTQPERGYSAISFAPSLKKFRKTKLVLYHASLNEEAAYLSAVFPNVYVEPSWLAFTPSFFIMMEKLGGYGKMLAGTDGPGWFSSFNGSPYKDIVAKAKEFIRPGNDGALEMFCSGNARKLLKLK